MTSTKHWPLLLSDENAIEAVNNMTARCHSASVNGGWYQNLAFQDQVDKLKCIGLEARTIVEIFNAMGMSESKKRNVGELLALIHSEISEAMEGHRKNLMDDKLPHRKMIEVELADAMIRIHDLAGYLELDLGGAIIEKMAYNQKRADHKPENRAMPGGKAY